VAVVVWVRVPPLAPKSYNKFSQISLLWLFFLFINKINPFFVLNGEIIKKL